MLNIGVDKAFLAFRVSAFSGSVFKCFCFKGFLKGVSKSFYFKMGSCARVYLTI